jgi:hypothetical protein
MDIKLLSFKEGQWVYQNADQHALLGDCAVLLHWDLYPFDRWLFDSQNWSMYTRRRQDLIALRSELAMAYGKASDQAARELLIVRYCMTAWKSTRALERRDCPEVRDLEFANARAKALLKSLTQPVHARRTRTVRSNDPGMHRLLNTLAFAN